MLQIEKSCIKCRQEDIDGQASNKKSGKAVKTEGTKYNQSDRNEINPLRANWSIKEEVFGKMHCLFRLYPSLPDLIEFKWAFC